MAFDFDAAVTAPFRMQPGLRRLAPARSHFTPLAPGSRHQREKLAVLSAFASEAIVEAPGFDAGPALQAWARQAAMEHPDALRVAGGRVEALHLGVAVTGDHVSVQAEGVFGTGHEVPDCLRALPGWMRLPGLLSLALAEDVAVVDAASGTVPWMAVALPSGWAPQEKVGLPLAALHAPVADGERVRTAAPHLAQLVTEGSAWERFVWTVAPHPRLHAHPARIDPAPWVPDPTRPIETAAWWRTERQTFLPVPGHRQALFTIGVAVQALPAAIDTPERARRLRDALATMTPAVLAYKNLQHAQPALLAWLDRQAAAHPAR